jgi:predicted flap endonuclease-1-like 5' DNA nuclease
MDNIEICRAAWNATKKDTQPAYDELIQSYRDMLSARAAKVVREGVTSGDTLDAFERQVASEAKVELVPSADQGYEQVMDTETVEEAEAARLERAKKREEAQPDTDEPETTTEAEKEHLDLKGPLPKDFPFHDKLHDAGINTYGQLNKVEDLTEIAGIGPASAKAIKKRLKADAKTLNA